MATKAELEAELAELRRQMAEARRERAAGGVDSDTAKEEPPPDDIDGEAYRGLSEVLEELESAAETHPHLALLGVFMAGLIVGRILAR